MKHRKSSCLTLLLAVLLAALALLPVSAEEASPTIEDYWLTDVQWTAVYTETAPTVDGSVTDEEWRNASVLVYDPADPELQAVLTEYGGLCTDETKAWPEGNKATLRFLWDENALYILDSRVDDFVYYESPATPGGTSAALPWSKAEGAIFGIQPLESLCLSEADGDIWQFYTTLADDGAQPNGAIQLRMTYPTLSAKSYVDLPEGVQCAAALTDDGWQMEIAIPWSCIQERYPVFAPEAGYQMSFRISIGNYLENGKMYFYNYTDAYKNFALSQGNSDFGGYPVLALADAEGNVPEYDMSIPSTLQPDDPGGDDPSGEETDADTGEEPQPTEEPSDEVTTVPPTPTGELSGNGETPAEPQKPNTVLIVVLAIVMIAAMAAAVVVIVRIGKLVVRIMAGVLALAILVGCIVGISAAVRNSGGDSGQGGPTSPAQTSAESGEPMPESKVPDDLMFPGETVSILIREDFKEEFDAEYSGALIDNEVFERNENVQARLGVTLDFVSNSTNASTEYLNTVRTSIMGGPYYDIITTYAYYGSALAAENLYYNLNTVDSANYISTELPWYNQSFVQECSYNGLLYFIVGDVTLTATDRSVVTFFNEDLFGDYHPDYTNGLSDLYAVVRDGNWTLEYVQELIHDVYDDVDRDGEQSGGDLYGMVFNNGSMCVDAMLMAVGIPLVEKTADGNIQVAFQEPQYTNAFSELFDFIYQSDGLYRGTTANDEYYGTTTNYFSDEVFYNGRCMLEFGLLESAKTFATDVTLHYGILPLPKLNSGQEGYATTPQDAYSIVSMPYNIGADLGLATATLEVMSEYSYRDVRPVYHELAYKVRYASSDITGELFDMIIDSIAYDFGSLYGASIEDPLHKIRNMLAGYNQAASANLGSIYRVFGGTIEEKLDDLLADFDQQKQ